MPTDERLGSLFQHQGSDDGWDMGWAKLLALIAGSVDEEPLLRDAYLATENRILRRQIESRLRLTDKDRRTLAQMIFSPLRRRRAAG